MHPLTKELVGDPLDRDLNLRYFWVIEGLCVASEGLLRGNVLKEHKDPLHENVRARLGLRSQDSPNIRPYTVVEVLHTRLREAF